MLNKLRKLLLDLLFPSSCLGCGVDGELICKRCYTGLLDSLKTKDQEESAGNLDRIWIVLDYSCPLVSKIIKTFKYNFVSELSGFLARLLIIFLAKKDLISFDLVIPVPLARKRKLWRGFNQAELLASKVAGSYQWPFRSNLIYRRLNNRPQVGLNASRRQQNVKGIFEIKENISLHNKRILLIDDVLTTGATLQECARLLKNKGAKEITALVIAKNS